MNWQVTPLRVFSDNIVWVIHNSQKAVVVDPGESAAVVKFLDERRLTLESLLITHHHQDHIGGVRELLNQKAVPTYAPAKESAHFDFNFIPVGNGSLVAVDGLNFQVVELPGHTLGHLAFWEKEQMLMFSGDVLFALGCGRIFEGTYEETYASLKKLKELPDETHVFCAHDYFSRNRAFCEKNRWLLEGYQPQLPLSLAQEKKFNPFLNVRECSTFRVRREARNLF